MVRQAPLTDDNRRNDHPGQRQPGVARNLADFTHDLVTLGELQGRLLLADFRQGRTDAIVAAILLVGAPVLLLAAAPVLLMGISWLLIDLADWPPQAAYLTVAGLTIIVAAIAAWIGYLRIRKAANVFDRSRIELNENLRWIKTALKRPSLH